MSDTETFPWTYKKKEKKKATPGVCNIKAMATMKTGHGMFSHWPTPTSKQHHLRRITSLWECRLWPWDQISNDTVPHIESYF